MHNDTCNYHMIIRRNDHDRFTVIGRDY